MFQDEPRLYFIPQIPNEGQWYRWYQRSKQFAWERLLRQALLRSDVNPDKVYVFGISEGGYGSQRIASFYADYWAAAGPMAGGEPRKNAPAETWGIVLKFERDYMPGVQMGFRLYLDETMIVFYRPVTVTVNGRTVFEGKVRPNLNAMLASVATFYDPRRIFPAFIDIE